MEELIKRLERVIQTGAPDKDGLHPIAAEVVLEVVKELTEHGTNLAEVDTDTISRQAAIETVMECYDNDELFEVYEDKLRELPPAFATDINVGDKDTISRKAAIDAVNCVMVMKGIRGGKGVVAEAVESAKRIMTDNIRQLPPALPKRGKWIKISPANIYECSKCGKSVMTNDICAYDFCHGCGADMREVTE